MTMPSLAGAPWLTHKSAQAVFAALEKSGFEARAVGGAVRNTLLGLPVKDVDIATTAQPLNVLEAAAAAGLKTIPTGLKHGTVTVISGRIPFEVTTLRRDAETDGRHAKVEFTDNWTEDAQRRDFTINALYCDRYGQVFDPIGGYPDIEARRVRFIGKAEDRIREDYLRILRFFRFTSEYATGPADAVGLKASADLKDGISRLSGERLRSELLRILETPGAALAVGDMHETGILALVLGMPGNLDRLERLIAREQLVGLAPDGIRRLGALAVTWPGSAMFLSRQLHLSNAEYERLATMAMAGSPHASTAPETDIKAYIYRNGASAYRDCALMVWAADETDGGATDRYRNCLELAQSWKVPHLPVNGADVMDLGLASGPRVGRVLSAFEDWWITADFPTDASLLAAKLSEFVKVTKA